MNEKVLRVVMTKKRLWQRVCNCYTAYRTYVVYFKAYIGEHTFYRVRDIYRIYDEDICEYEDCGCVSKTRSDIVASEMLFNNILCYEGLTIDKIRAWCNKHIDEYNESVRGY